MLSVSIQQPYNDAYTIVFGKVEFKFFPQEANASFPKIGPDLTNV